MKKYTVAVPVVIALLTFGIAGKSMANPKDVDADKASAKGKVAAAANDDSTATANDYSTSAKDHSVVFSDSTVGTLTDINVGDVRVVASVSTLNGTVSNNSLSFGKELEMTATGGNKGGDASSELSQKNKASQSNDLSQKNKPTASNDLSQKNKPDGSNEANLKNKSGEANKADQDNAIGKDSNKAIQANRIGKESNKADQSNKAEGENAAFQASVATTGDYTNTQTQVVSLATGDNIISGTLSANGVNPIAMNSGIQSSIQQQVNVQANFSTLGGPGL
jgi:hypothetical protein